MTILTISLVLLGLSWWSYAKSKDATDKSQDWRGDNGPWA